MKAKLVYGLIVGLLVSLSGALYLYDRHDEKVAIKTDTSKAIDGGSSHQSRETEMIVVYLTGAVVKPDIYEIPEESRLYELIETAGGFSEHAAKDHLNLARYVFDGEMIHVPTMADNVESSIDEGRFSSGKVNINRGDLDDLMGLTGIGETKAEAIIDYRENNGPFQRIEDIMNVDGIKDAMFNKIKEDITI